MMMLKIIYSLTSTSICNAYRICMVSKGLTLTCLYYILCAHPMPIKLVGLKLLTILNSFLLNVAEHENFSANKYENANFS